MFGNLKFKLLFLLPLSLIGISLLRLVNVDDLPETERAGRILRLNLRVCGEISQIGREYGEGTSTVTCPNGKTYLISAREHCNTLFTAYCWQVTELDAKTGKRRNSIALDSFELIRP